VGRPAADFLPANPLVLLSPRHATLQSVRIGHREQTNMSTQKHPMSIYTVMLILAMIFMFLANVLMFAEYFRWRDTGTVYVNSTSKLA
jgi:hypothetical protein